MLIKEFKNNTFVISSVACSSDGKRILTGSEENIASLWDIQTGTLIISVRSSPPYGFYSKRSSIVVSPDNETILTGSYDKTTCIWSTKTSNQILQLSCSAEVKSALFSPDGKRVLIDTYHNEMGIWTMLPCDATTWILEHGSLFHAWLIVKASNEKREMRSFMMKEGSLEHELFIQLPDYVQNYLIQWYFLVIKNENYVEGNFLDKDTYELPCSLQ